MGLLVSLIDLGLHFYVWIIIAQVVLSWLIIFDVVNASSKQAQNLIRLIKKATDPVYKPLKKYVPAIGGIDITPLIVIIGVQILRSILYSVLL